MPASDFPNASSPAPAKALVSDEVMIFDNSEGKHELIAEKTIETEIDIFNQTKFNRLKNYYHGNT